jgi:hypothetical protein
LGGKKTEKTDFSLSSTEAEYMAMSEATKEAIYLQNLLEELGTPRKLTVLHIMQQGVSFPTKQGCLNFDVEVWIGVSNTLKTILNFS